MSEYRNKISIDALRSNNLYIKQLTCHLVLCPWANLLSLSMTLYLMVVGQMTVSMTLYLIEVGDMTMSIIHYLVDVGHMTVSMTLHLIEVGHMTVSLTLYLHCFTTN